ncbi:hypothetical protein AAF712_011991 [Marasmius tenuissimus]|uniref:Uncharacterized protein n=1 Tax=Marasmius tenuissimus TaxID=585030 RepID=A0ABR2ZJJ6_9AGAR
MNAGEYKRKSLAMGSALSSLGLGAIWSSRISLALSIARILPPCRLRTIAIGLSVGCFVAGIATLTVKLVVFNDPVLQKKLEVQRLIFATVHIVGEHDLVFVILGLIAFE